MSTINPVGPHTSSLSAEGVAGTTNAAGTEPTQDYTPLWQISTSSSSPSLALLGIRMPNASGDLAVMLAQASLSLEQSIDESRKSSAMSRLAGIVAALGAYDLEALKATVDRREKAVNDAQENLNKVNEETEGLLAEREAQNSRIQYHNDRIEDLEAALANPDLTDSQRTYYSAQLAGERAGLASALAERERIDIEIANARIDSLDRQAADLEARLAAEDPDSPEAAEIAAELAETRAQAADARQQLEDFQNGPKTEAARTEFSNSNAAALEAEIQDLSERLEVYREKHVIAKGELDIGTSLAVATIISATAWFNQSQTAEINQQGNRDLGIEREFEKIFENLQAAQEAASQKLENIAERQDLAAEDQRDDRIRQLALGLVTTLSDIVSLIARIEPDGLTPTSVLPTNGARVRLEV